MHQVPNVQGRVWSFKGAYLEKKIKPRALELGYSGLHRSVQDEDLVATEAQFHPSCRKSFNLRCPNYLRDIARTKSPEKTDTDQERNKSAHLKEFTVVLDFIQDRIDCTTSLYICYWRISAELNNSLSPKLAD